MLRLFVDRSERWVVAPYQHPHMLVVDTQTGDQQAIPWDEAQDLAPTDPDRELFVLTRTIDDDTCRISLHPFDAPTRPVARVTVNANGTADFEGLREAWNQAPQVFYYYFGPAPGHGDQTLIVLAAQRGNVELQKLPEAEGWPEKGGIAGIVEIPGSSLVVISLHHDTFDPRPIIYDPNKRAVVGRIPLADAPIGYGQSNPRFLRTRPEAWLIDFANLQRHRLPSWEITEARRLQPPRNEVRAGRMGPVHLWIGGLSFNQDESLGAVTRPYSGDVLGIEVSSFRVSHRALTGGGPLDIVLLSDRRIFTLERNTGELGGGRLEPWEPDEEFPSML